MTLPQISPRKSLQGSELSTEYGWGYPGYPGLFQAVHLCKEGDQNTLIAWVPHVSILRRGISPIHGSTASRVGKYETQSSANQLKFEIVL